MTTFTIDNTAAATANVLKKAFWRKSESIAKHFADLGKPMGGRTVRKMTEASPDVRRRNILENTVLLLAASRRESLGAFNQIWVYLESVAATLRGRVQMRPTIDEQVAEFRYASASADRAWFRGDRKEFEKALIYVDEQVKGLFAHLQVVV
jgi:hypothetical protein